MTCRTYKSKRPFGGTGVFKQQLVDFFILDLGGVRQARAAVQRMGDACEPQ